MTIMPGGAGRYRSDGVPELFLMEAGEQPSGPAHLYGEEWRDGGDEEAMPTAPESLLSDVAAGAGVNYVVFTGKDGKFYIYRTSGIHPSHLSDLHLYGGRDHAEAGWRKMNTDRRRISAMKSPMSIPRNGKENHGETGRSCSRIFQNLDKAIPVRGYDKHPSGPVSIWIRHCRVLGYDNAIRKEWTIKWRREYADGETEVMEEAGAELYLRYQPLNAGRYGRTKNSFTVMEGASPEFLTYCYISARRGWVLNYILCSQKMDGSSWKPDRM